MMRESDQPKLSEVLDGWFIVREGKAWLGDKYWRPHDRTWLPLISSDMKHGIDVREKGMPTVIRRVREAR